MRRVLNRLKKTKFFSGLLNGMDLKMGLSIFLLLSQVVIVIILGMPYKPYKTELKKDPKIALLEDSIKKARSITSPLAREVFIQDEAKRLSKTSDEYRRLYTLSKESLNSIPDAPKNPFYIIVWYFSDLNPEQRFQVLWNGIPWLINILSKSAILLVAVRFILEIPEREKQAKYQAWQVIHSAYGQKSSGARIAALEDLLTQQESLRGLSLEEGANLELAELSGADLTGAFLKGANLEFAKLSGADLTNANLRDANLKYAFLTGANLTNTDLTGADLREAFLRDVILGFFSLKGANLENADLREADLTNANLTDANLENADLREANLKYANLKYANLTGASLTGANLTGAKNLLSEQIRSADDWENALYDGKPLNDPENIKKLGVDENPPP